MGVSREKFQKALKNFYTKEGIYSLYKTYFIDWLGEGFIGLHLDIFEVSLLSEKTEKSVFLDLLEEAFYKREIFVTIFDSLDEEVKEVFRTILWSGKYLLEQSQLKEFFIDENGYKTNETLKDKFKFFHYKKSKLDKDSSGYLYLDNDIIRKIRPYCTKKARDYFIHPIEDPIFTYLNNSETEICKKFSLYYEFYTQGNIKLSSTLKLLKESKRDMQKYCDISEFYDESKDLDFLKTESIGLLFYAIKDEYLKPENFRISRLERLVNNFLNGKLLKNSEYNYTTKYLNYLKGVKNIKNPEKISRALESIKKIITQIPSKKVVSISNITKYLIYRDEFLEIIEQKDVYDYIYINESNYGRTRITGYDEYQKYIIEPFIKSVFFLLGSLGVFKLYYDLPSGNNGLFLKNNYLSKYDGLKYVELTELGEYIFGRRDDYNFVEDTESTEIVYDEELYHITIMGEAPILSMYLEKKCLKIGLNKYKMDSGRFLKGIETFEELEEKITEFRSKFHSSLPKVWDRLFETIKLNSNFLKPNEEIKVFHVKQDREFFKVLSQDKELKKLILKAEGFYVLIKKEDVKHVQKILLKYGYFNEL